MLRAVSGPVRQVVLKSWSWVEWKRGRREVKVLANSKDELELADDFPTRLPALDHTSLPSVFISLTHRISNPRTPLEPLHMKPRASDMQDALAKAQHELELSTFLNKGILQSNAEYKLRIAELEKQNILLRAAEKRLSSTEDALETCEQRLKTAEMERNAAVKEARRIAERVAGLEQERDGWKARFEAVREYWKSLLRGMDDVLDVQPPQHASGSIVRSDPMVSRSAVRMTLTTATDSPDR